MNQGQTYSLVVQMGTIFCALFILARKFSSSSYNLTSLTIVDHWDIEILQTMLLVVMLLLYMLTCYVICKMIIVQSYSDIKKKYKDPKT